jgi:hypothetical protein
MSTLDSLSQHAHRTKRWCQQAEYSISYSIDHRHCHDCVARRIITHQQLDVLLLLSMTCRQCSSSSLERIEDFTVSIENNSSHYEKNRTSCARVPHCVCVCVCVSLWRISMCYFHACKKRVSRVSERRNPRKRKYLSCCVDLYFLVEFVLESSHRFDITTTHRHYDGHPACSTRGWPTTDVTAGTSERCAPHSIDWCSWKWHC